MRFISWECDIGSWMRLIDRVRSGCALLRTVESDGPICLTTRSGLRYMECHKGGILYPNVDIFELIEFLRQLPS